MKRMKGFTLIEMIITITLIIILSTISIPRYKDYSLSAKKAEGYSLLSSIRDMQKQYRTEYGTFFRSNSWTAYHELLGIDARTNKYFTSFCVGGPAGGHYFSAGVTSKDFGKILLKFNLSENPGQQFSFS